MKLRALPVVACVMLCATWVCAQNLLQNPGFESDGSWTFYEDAGREQWESAVRTGSWGAALYGWNVGKWGGGYQHVGINTADGNIFTFMIYAKAESGFLSSGEELYMKMEFKIGDTEQYNVQRSIYQEAISDKEHWNLYTFVHTNDNPAINRVTVVFGGGGFSGPDGNRCVMFDDSSLTQTKQLPTVMITNPASDVAVSNSIGSYTVRGSAAQVVGTMAWTNAGVDGGSFPASSNWSFSTALAVGENQLSVLASNVSGVTTSMVTITRHAPAPSVQITSPSSGTQVSKSVNTYSVVGTCNANTLGIRWDNGHGSTGVGELNSGSWTSLVALAFGTNHVAIIGTNSTGLAVSNTVVIIRESNPPRIIITDPTSDITVSNDVDMGELQGAIGNGAVGDVTWVNQLTGGTGTVPGFSPWSITNIALDVGKNTLVVSCSNVAGEVASASVSITRLAAFPEILITYPASDINVGNGVTTYTVMGSSADAEGDILLINARTGEERTTPAPAPGAWWMIDDVVLGEGANVITVYGSNTTGQAASDTVTIYRDYVKADLWINEIHYANTNWPDYNEGIEIAGPAGSVLDQYSLYLYGPSGWVYNSNQLSGAIDSEAYGCGAVWFAYDDGTGDAISNGPSCGIALAYKGELMEFISYGLNTIYGNDGPAAGHTSVDIGNAEDRDTPMWYSLQLQGVGTNYATMKWCGPMTNSYGLLNPGQIISGDRDGNGIPDVWQDIYWPPYLTIDPNEDDDGDTFSNIQEFYADTKPTSAASLPELGKMWMILGYPVLRFESSTQRSYLLEQRADLLSGGWTNVGEAFMGSGGTNYVVVPQTGDQGFYRYRVWMPGL